MMITSSLSPHSITRGLSSFVHFICCLCWGCDANGYSSVEFCLQDLLNDNGLMMIVTPIFTNDKVLDRVRSWGWPAEHRAVMLFGTPLKGEDMIRMFEDKKPPITRQMLADVDITSTSGLFPTRLRFCCARLWTAQMPHQSPICILYDMSRNHLPRLDL